MPAPVAPVSALSLAAANSSVERVADAGPSVSNDPADIRHDLNALRSRVDFLARILATYHPEFREEFWQ